MNEMKFDLTSFSRKPDFIRIPGSVYTNDASEYSEAHEEISREFDLLEVDKYMRNGEIYRLRRLTKYVADTEDRTFAVSDNQIFFQDHTVNSYASGVKREYPELSSSLVNNPILQRLSFIGLDAIQPLHQNKKWIVGVHFIRTVCVSDELAKPSPDGAHQDGHDYLSISVVQRKNVTGGETNVLDLNKNLVSEFTLTDYLETVFVNDKTMYHDAKPIYRENREENGIRDVIIIDYDII